MKITKEALGNLILEEIQKLEEKPSPQARRQKKREAKAKRRQARKEKAASPKPQGKPQQKQKLSPEEQEARFQKLAFGDEPEKEKSPQAAAKDAAQQAKKTEKATTKAGLQKATGEKVDTSEQPEEIQKVSNEIEKLQKRLQSWATKTASKIPADDKEARLAVMKIPMALKVANQSIDKISKQDNESLQAVLSGEKPAAQGEEAEKPAAQGEEAEEQAANRREVEEAVIYDLEELLKNEM